MKERRKIFSAADLAAIRDGRKTMFREMVVPEPGPLGIHPAMRQQMAEKPPLGTIGGRLWLPEAWAGDKWCGLLYQADGVELPIHCEEITISRWNPAITMPRWACRTFAEITRVRVERVADITEEDAKKEGMESLRDRCASLADFDESMTDRDLFTALWQSIYANWDADPWVRVYSIKLIKL